MAWLVAVLEVARAAGGRRAAWWPVLERRIPALYPLLYSSIMLRDAVTHRRLHVSSDKLQQHTRESK